MNLTIASPRSLVATADERSVAVDFAAHLFQMHG
jgi:hypothetical protein